MTKFSNNNTQQLTELVLKMVEQNQELTKQIIELIKTGGNNHYNTNDITPTDIMPPDMPIDITPTDIMPNDIRPTDVMPNNALPHIGQFAPQNLP